MVQNHHSPLKVTSVEFFSSSTIHGLPKIAKAKHTFSKLTWTIFLCIALASSSFLIYDKVTNYLEYQVITNSQKLTENSPEFPTVTICAKYSRGWRTKTCWFNGEPCNNTYFKRKNDACFDFNSGLIWGDGNDQIAIETLRSKQKGSLYGLRLVMTSNYRLERFKIYINNHSVRLDSTKALETSVGQEISLSITRTFLNKLSPPYSKCRSEVAFDLNLTVTSFPYLKSDCVMLFCYYEIVATECNKSKELEANAHLYYTDSIAFTMFAIYLQNNCSIVMQKTLKNFLQSGTKI